MSYCICMMNENPENCAIFLRSGEHAGWNPLNLDSVRETGAKFTSRKRAEKLAREMADMGVAATVEPWDDIADMIPKNEDGSYRRCECEICQKEKE